MAQNGMSPSEVKSICNELEISPSKSQGNSPIGGNKHTGKSKGKK